MGVMEQLTELGSWVKVWLPPDRSRFAAGRRKMLRKIDRELGKLLALSTALADREVRQEKAQRKARRKR